MGRVASERASGICQIKYVDQKKQSDSDGGLERAWFASERQRSAVGAPKGPFRYKAV